MTTTTTHTLFDTDGNRIGYVRDGVAVGIDRNGNEVRVLPYSTSDMAVCFSEIRFFAADQAARS